MDNCIFTNHKQIGSTEGRERAGIARVIMKNIADFIVCGVIADSCLVLNLSLIALKNCKGIFRFIYLFALIPLVLSFKSADSKKGD